jgi:hypothetical protein
MNGYVVPPEYLALQPWYHKLFNKWLRYSSTIG